MASYAENKAEGDAVSSDDMQGMMVQKAHELFVVCDKESKGFITKRDMQRLQAELSLSPEQLESVFDSLDDDSNGFLTLEEFTGGFAKNQIALPTGQCVEEDSCVKLSLEELKSFKRLALVKERALSGHDDAGELSIQGFGCGGAFKPSSFLGMAPALQHQDSITSSVGGSDKVYENEEINDESDDSEQFDDLLSTLGAHGIFEEVDIIKSLWGRIRKDEPEMLCNFEDFLGRVTLDIKRSHSDLNTLEGALKNKSLTHDEEVRKLYDEMENQIRLEKERILSEEKARERHLRDEMDKELMDKERQLTSFQSKTQDMEDRLSRLNMYESETKLENDKLMREKEELEVMLIQSQKHLHESKAYINSLRKKHKEEKRERAMTALQVSEGIAMERESLVKQLDMLRVMNRRLRDDKDEMDMKRDQCSTHEQDQSETVIPSNGRLPPGAGGANEDDSDEDGDGDAPPTTPGASRHNRPHLLKQGSILSSYFGQSRSASLTKDPEEEEEDVECEDFEIPFQSKARLFDGNDMSLASELSSINERLRGLRNSISDSEDVFDDIDGSRPRRRRNRRSRERNGPANGMAAIMREQPVGANDITASPEVVVETVTTTPERVFKIVFVGDSGVGKSSYIHRFCNSEFKPNFSATIGVDFQVKSLLVDNHCVALQLWDTAGQERFRSITKQYFRKADGVLIMYDVTSESSFLNVRNWFSSVQDGCEEGTVLVLVGNKTDLAEEEDQRIIKTKDGANLADECDAIFFETSAKDGSNVHETMTAMASILREREDIEMEKALHLQEPVIERKMGCCS